MGKAGALLLALMGALVARPALAADCFGVVTVGEPAPKLALVRVKAGQGRVNFVENGAQTRPKCPSAEAVCQRKAFLLPGDQVLVADAPGPYVCASYKSPKGAQTDGWLPAQALEPVAVELKDADWIGSWRRDAEGSITIKGKGPDLAISGEATYGALDRDRVRRGAVNLGELSGTARPSGNRIALGEHYDGLKPPSEAGTDDCLARLRLYGRYLYVEDNGSCGGANVRFDGLYVRAGR